MFSLFFALFEGESNVNAVVFNSSLCFAGHIFEFNWQQIALGYVHSCRFNTQPNVT